MIKIIVAGAVGKMGSAIIKVISSDYNFKLVGATEQSSNKLLNQDAEKLQVSAI